MSNEEKILEMLGEINSEMGAMKSDIEALKQSNGRMKSLTPTAEQQMRAIERWSNLPDDDGEMARFCKFMDAEEERKAALYGK